MTAFAGGAATSEGAETVVGGVVGRWLRRDKRANEGKGQDVKHAHMLSILPVVSCRPYLAEYMGDLAIGRSPIEVSRLKIADHPISDRKMYLLPTDLFSPGSWM